MTAPDQPDRILVAGDRTVHQGSVIDQALDTVAELLRLRLRPPRGPGTDPLLYEVVETATGPQIAELDCVLALPSGLCPDEPADGEPAIDWSAAEPAWQWTHRAGLHGVPVLVLWTDERLHARGEDALELLGSAAASLDELALPF